jgi:alpha-D-ribose 1-methylphosphonate 5-triphosphate diphosphatase
MQCCEEGARGVTRVINGRVVTEDAVRLGVDLLIQDDRIAGIEKCAAPGPDETVVDAAGGWVLPGFIDLHADYIEQMAAPRPTAVMDFHLAIREAERELLTHGVTTMFHSVCFYAHSEFGRGPMREPENARRFVGIVQAAHRQSHLIRHRVHARFEIDSLDRVGELADYLRTGTVHLLSFMDHTPGQGQYRNLEVYRATLKAWKGMGDEEVAQSIRESRARQKMTLGGIREVSQLARSCKVAVASHDDDSVDKLSLVNGFGATISEFPTTLEVARHAREIGMHVVAGAPNVLLGGSHSGNLSATEAVREGAVDILCSDYYPAALLHALFALARETRRELPELVRLVTLNPARAVMMDGEVGSLRPGKKADLVVVRQLENGFPVITQVMVDGRSVLQMSYREGST